ALVLPPGGVGGAPPPATAQQRVGLERVVVELQPNAGDPGNVAALLQSAFGLLVGHTYRTALSGFSAVLPAAMPDLLPGDPRALRVAPGLPVHVVDQPVPTGVRRIGADHNATARIGTGANAVAVDVAVIDTGVGPHNDLNVVGGTDCTGTGSYNDDNGHG